MSSRLKERGGGGCKIMASKPTKAPIHSTPKDKGAAAARRTPVAAGKENHRTLSGGKMSATRPNPVPKLVEKPAAVRWSTSTLPRCKVPNPSVLISDLRGELHRPRVSASDRMGRALGRDLEAEAGGRRSLGGTRASDRCKGVSDSGLKKNGERLMCRISVSDHQSHKPNGFMVLKSAKKDTNTSDVISAKLGGSTGSGAASEKCKQKVVASKPMVADGNGSSGKEIPVDEKNEAPPLANKPGLVSSNGSSGVETSKNNVFLASSSASVDGQTTNHVPGLNGLKDKSGSPSNSKAHNQIVEDVACVSLNDKKKDCLNIHSETLRGVSGDIEIKEHLNEEVCAYSAPVVEVAHKPSANIRVFEKVNDDVKGAHVCKYPSKLHEKLAMLEGKVQRIASEIKRTKDMLDSNNPDDSKLILSDIQNKISGIEKAVAHAIDGTTCQLGSSKIIKVNCQDSKNLVSGQTEETGVSSHSVMGLNHEELESRLFPHHKLLKNRRSSCVSGGHGPNHSDPDFENGAISYTDEDPIALEFLASLNSEQSESNKCTMFLESGRMAVRASGVEKSSSTAQYVSKKTAGERCKGDIELMANENLEDFDNQENRPAMVLHVDTEEPCKEQICEIGRKPSTGGWFVSEGEAVLLAHDDGSCSYYDIANYEFKAEYKPPSGVSNNLWGDCWLIRAPGADGCSGKYVVAASAGNALESGFCSWDFYTREVRAFSIGDVTNNSVSSSSSNMVLGPLNNTVLRSSSCAVHTVGQQRWWYKPCGPLLFSTASRQKFVSGYDIRDGDLVMKWEVNSPVMGMEYSSPLQWRSRGKVIIAGTEAISLWDVNSLEPQPLLSIACAGKKVYSLHVNNTDAELGGGVRQRVSSSEVEGNDGVFCTQDSINVLDFRVPAGVGIKISRHGGIGHSIFSRGESVFVGSTEGRLAIKGNPRVRVQHYSLRKGKLVTMYELPELNTHFHHSSLTQVWGNTNIVMGICGMGLFVFDALQDDRSQAFCFDRGSTIGVRETIGPDDLYCPTFDYSGSRVLVISRDRPAFWRYLL